MISRTRVEPRDDIYAPSGIVMCQEGLFCAWKVLVTCWNANENCEAIFGGKNAGLPFMLTYQSLLTKDSKTDLLTALLQEPPEYTAAQKRGNHESNIKRWLL